MKSLFSKLSEKNQDRFVILGGTALISFGMIAALAGLYAAIYHDFHSAGLV
jgi:hypothetical protein